MSYLRSLLIFMALALFNIMTVGSTAAAAMRCDTLFGREWKWGQDTVLDPYNGELSSEKLKEHGLQIKPDGSLYALEPASGKSLKLGLVKTLSVHYLFEWADKKESDAWIKAGRIDYIDEILKAPGQTSGKGYYVSTDPLDSSGYGNAVTSFRQTEKIVVLEYLVEKPQMLIDRMMQQNTQLVTRLSRAGIDALQAGDGYQKSWFSIISNKPLQNASALHPAILDHYLRDVFGPEQTEMGLKSVKLVFLPKVLKEIWEGLPADHLFRRFYLKENMSLQELSKFLEPFPGFARNNFDSLLFEHIKRLLSEAKTPKDVANVLQLNSFNTTVLDAIRTPEDKKIRRRLGSFGELLKTEKEAFKYTAENVSSIQVLMHVEVLNNWILDGKSAAETTRRADLATKAFLKMFKYTPEAS